MRWEPLGLACTSPHLQATGVCPTNNASLPLQGSLCLTSSASLPLAAGEFIPVRCEPLDLAYIDGMLLLPLIIEHTIGGAPHAGQASCSLGSL